MYYGYNFIYMMVFNTLFFVTTLALVLWVVKTGKNINSPESIVKIRYAKGEISKEEYDKIINELKSI